MASLNIDTLLRILRPAHQTNAEQDVLICEEGKRVDAELAIVRPIQQQIDIAEKISALCALASTPSPIHQVPFELLAKTFAMASFGDFLHIPPSKGNKRKKKEMAQSFTAHARLTSLAITQVCVYWREVAQQTPTMWDYSITFHGPFKETLKECYNPPVGNIRRLYGANPIPSIHLDFTAIPNHWQLGKLLTKYQGEFDSLHISAVLFLFGVIVAGGRVDAPRLKELVLNGIAAPTGSAATLHTPRLVKVTVCSPGLRFANISIAWRQLTHLSIGCLDSSWNPHNVSMEELFRAIEQAPDLANLHLCCINITTTTGLDPALRALREKKPLSLRTMEIQDPHLLIVGSQRPETNPVDFFSCLTTPSLEAFDFIFSLSAGFRGLLKADFHRVIAFLQRNPSLGQIRVVALTDAWLSKPFAYPIALPPTIMEFSGGHSFFDTLTSVVSDDDTPNLDATRRFGETMNAPIRAWNIAGSNVITTNHFIDRFLERGNPYYQRPIWRGEVVGPGSRKCVW